MQKRRGNLKNPKTQQKPKISRLWGGAKFRNHLPHSLEIFVFFVFFGLFGFLDVFTRSGKLGLGEGCTVWKLGILLVRVHVGGGNQPGRPVREGWVIGLGGIPELHGICADPPELPGTSGNLCRSPGTPRNFSYCFPYYFRVSPGTPRNFAGFLCRSPGTHQYNTTL